MIRIEKGAAPTSLVTKGQVLVDDLKRQFDKSPEQYATGKPAMEFSEEYKTANVVKTLRILQHKKCCFTEEKVVSDYAHVEHFRPKGRIDLWPEGHSLYPGYYWLAYDWSNLLLCKAKINVSFKKNYFPLSCETNRNLNHMSRNFENPMLVNPSEENPRKHIVFNGYEPSPLTEKGRITIELLGLRHSDLFEARMRKFRTLKKTRLAVETWVAAGLSKSDSAIVDLIEELRFAVLPDAEFSSMAIDFLRDMPLVWSCLDKSEVSTV